MMMKWNVDMSWLARRRHARAGLDAGAFSLEASPNL
jgi:hypothetical protein